MDKGKRMDTTVIQENPTKTPYLSGFINGVWVGSSSNRTFDVLNPSTGNVIAQVADMGKVETEAAIDAAHNRFHSKEWYSLTAKDRSQLLKVYSQNPRPIADP